MKCYACQAEVTADDRFCSACDHPFPWTPADDPALREALVDFDLPGLTELRTEKERLAGQLTAMLERVGERTLTDGEKRAWGELYAEWQDVSDSVTDRMQRFSRRLDPDRRTGPTRRADRRQQAGEFDGPERRQQERRGSERRSGTDRRDPFSNGDG